MTVIIWLTFLIVTAFGAPNKNKKGKNRANRKQARYAKEEVDWNTPYKMFIVLGLLIFGPVIGGFVYSVAKDPATPDVLRAIWVYVKDRTSGYLGRRREEQEQQQHEE